MALGPSFVTSLTIVLMVVATVHAVTSNNTLEEMLCMHNNGTNLSAMTLELLSSQVYTISPGDFCIVSNVTDLTIQGNDSSSPTVIRCLLDEHDNYLSARGLAFINARRLTLANVVFENCGAELTEDVLGQANSSRVYFSQGEAVTLVCNDCCNLSLSNVTIRNYTGRALLGLDVFGGSILDGVVVSDNAHINQNDSRGFNTFKGSGIVWMYTNTVSNACSLDGNTEVSVTNSEFSYNRRYLEEESQYVEIGCADSLADSFFSTNSLFEPFDLPNVGAMTLIYQQYSPVQINITKSIFTGNSGQCFGAILAVYLSGAQYGSLHFSESTFSNNGALLFNTSNGGRRYFGSVVTLYIKYLGNYSENECLTIDNSRFVEADTTSQVSLVQFPDSSGFCLASLRSVISGNNRLLYALSLGAGDSLEVHLSDVHLIGDEVSSSPSLGVGFGLLTFSFLTRVIIEDSEFHQLNGPVVYAEATYIIFSGTVVFDGAVGASWTGGAAMFLRGESVIWLKDGLDLTFRNNSAFKGGAILSISIYAEYCAIQFMTEDVYTYDNIGDIDIRVNFISNRARVAGNSMYVSPLINCSLRISPNIEVDPTTIYNNVFKFDLPVQNELLEISSNPIQICMCGDDPQNTSRPALKCDGDSIPTINTFPGKLFELSVVPIDENSTRVYSLVYSNPESDNTSTEVEFDWHLGYGEDIVQAPGYNCTTLPFSVFSANVDNEVNGHISIYPAGSVNGLLIPVVLSDCPPGFQLAHGTDSCDCLEFFTKQLSIGHIHCNTSSGLITRPGTSWIGIASYAHDDDRYNPNITATDVTIGFSDHCPTRYCNQSATVVNISDSSLCLHGRTGVLCGQCKEGLSVTIGSPECWKCMNWWLFTIALYAVLGVAIVAVLLVLQLTVLEGTINGLIFYANLLSVSTYSLFGYEGTQWALIFISFINLELGFPVCLYDGLDDIVKGLLSIAFPIYIWIIAVCIVYASRYSYRLSQLTSKSAVPVLATLIYITYYELLRFSVDGLAFGMVTLQPNISLVNSKPSTVFVWYYDGNVRYLNDFRHWLLFVLVLIVVCAFLIPYGIVLTGIRFFTRLRIVNKFKPLIDAYCAPYKDKYRFWFGLRLWVLVAVYALFAVLRNDPLVLFLCQSVILILFIVAQVAVMPFKNIIINWLDLFFMVNALLLTIVAVHNNSLGVQIASSISVAASIVVFCCIIGYHGWNTYKRLHSVWKSRQRFNVQQYTEPKKTVVTESSVMISNSSEGIQYEGFVNVNPARFRDSILSESVADIN